MTRAPDIAASRQGALRYGLPRYKGATCPHCNSNIRWTSNRSCALGCNASAIVRKVDEARYNRRAYEARRMRSSGLQVTPLNRLLWRLLFN